MSEQRRPNPECLKWARERAGISLQSLSEFTKINVYKLREMEEHEEEPSKNDIIMFANLYSVPVETFYFPEPPNDKHPWCCDWIKDKFNLIFHEKQHDWYKCTWKYCPECGTLLKGTVKP